MEDEEAVRAQGGLEKEREKTPAPSGIDLIHCVLEAGVTLVPADVSTVTAPSEKETL